MLPTLLLSLSGGLLLWGLQSRRTEFLLIDRLAAPKAQLAPPVPATVTDEQNLILSVGLLGMTTVGYLGVPWLRLLSLPGLLYLDLYFIRAAYVEWQAQRQIGIAVNDAVLATGLVVTRQLSAGSLFATFFFASRKLQLQAEKSLGHYQGSTSIVAEATVPNPQTALSQAMSDPLSDKPVWQHWIDRGALPLLTLGIVSTPLLGLKRALAVLLTNFGYDYRIMSPLSTLAYLKAAKARGIWFRDPHVLDRLQQIDLLLLEVDWDEQQIAQLQSVTPLQIMTLPTLDEEFDRASFLAHLQAEGRTIAYYTNQLHVPPTSVDLFITVARGPGMLNPNAAHVIFPADDPTQLEQIFALTQSLATTRQRGLYLALAPGVFNLGGIYFGHFGVITALLIDYGGALLGIINAAWPPLPASFQPDRSTTVGVRHNDLIEATLTNA